MMTLLSRYLVTFCLPLFSGARPNPTIDTLKHSSSDEAIGRNAFLIFNAVHSAFRQWGSSLNHNGMSFMLATVPEGQLLYHGTRSSERPRGLNGTGVEWLAFEVEHAQQFARSWSGGRGPRPGPPPLPSGPDEPLGSREAERIQASRTEEHAGIGSMDEEGTQKPLFRSGYDEPQEPPRDPPRRPPGFGKPARGYLQTYRANRDLRLLYVDGMGAGKSSYGTLDTQDYVLLDWPTEGGGPRRPNSGEFERAMGLCQMANEWTAEGGRIDGIVRMEAGFEIIFCHFEEGGGLDLLSVAGSPFANETGNGGENSLNFEWLRGVSHRYHGMPRGRVEVDWSSMVSAFFYDVNITNPLPSRPELPRLVSTTRTQRRAIRARIKEVALADSRQRQDINWQGIVDMIVLRYSDRMLLLENATSSVAKTMVQALLAPYTDYAGSDPYGPVLRRCSTHFLEPALRMQSSWTPEDRAIFLAVETVSREICSSLIKLRETLDGGAEGSVKDAEKEDRRVTQVIRPLMNKLQWTCWKDCGSCFSQDEICFVAMFPMGSIEDHFRPSCKNSTSVFMGQNYWRIRL